MPVISTHSAKRRKSGRLITFFALVFSTTGLTEASAQPLEIADDEWSRLSIELVVYEPFSPFSDLTYEWKMRGSSPMLAVSRGHVDGFGRESELTLITEDRFAQLLETLRVCDMDGGAEDLEPEATGDAAWAVLEVHRGVEVERVVWTGDDYLVASACVDAIRGPIEAELRFEDYRNPFWIEGFYGQLRADSDLPALVWIDGIDTGQVTPLIDYPLEPGPHEVTWVALQGGLERTETIVVEAGRTTTVNIRME